MALVPLQLRPKYVIRRRATQRGLLGKSTFWRVIAIVILGRGTIKKLFGRNSEPLGRRTIRPGGMISVAASAPLSRRQAKRAGISKDAIEARARADLEAVSSSS